MSKPVMLWLDCTARSNDEELQKRCAEFFQICYCAQLANAEREISRLAPQALCFEFDYPNKRQLRAMQDIKQKFQSIPILMLTLEHSEALAVWSFRARVWNYLVKPIPMQELTENLQALTQILATEATEPRRATSLKPEVPSQLPTGSLDDTRSSLLPGIYYIEQHFNEQISAGHIAQLCGMSRFRFSRWFHRGLGMTFQEYLLRYRVRRACELLQQPRASITDVGYSVGFNDASYFSRIFKRYMKMLPSQFAASAELSHRLNASPEDPESAPAVALT